MRRRIRRRPAMPRRRRALSSPASGSLQTKLVSLCKRRGFVFPSAEVYGGLSGAFDYGPLGAQLKRNVAERWWRDFVATRADVVGLDSAVVSSAAVWRAAGHVDGFVDALVECRKCQGRARPDRLVEGLELGADATPDELRAAGRRLEEEDGGAACPHCGERGAFTEPRLFNMLMETRVGVGEGQAAYLRPETAQGIFTNFHLVANTTRMRLPFGVGQVGKAFRNEISPHGFLFRTREFEQAELEYFCAPADAPRAFDEWVERCHRWLLDAGLRPDSLRLVRHAPDALAHYSDATTDIEFRFPGGWGELWGVSHRGDFDLAAHQRASGQDMTYLEPGRPKAEAFLPHVVEPSVGVDRLVFALLADAYDEDEAPTAAGGEAAARTVLRLHPDLAPFRFAVLPLMGGKEPQRELARRLADDLAARTGRPVDFDRAGAIGRRYRRQDEIGTPYCVTVDPETLEDGTVTVRDRDTMRQVRVPAEAVVSGDIPSF